MNKKRRGRLRKTNAQFKKEVYDMVGDKYEFLEEYRGTHVKILCKHKKCKHTYEVSPSNFLSGSRCPECARKAKMKTNKQFVQEVYDLVGNKYEFLEKYKGSKTKILCLHSECSHQYSVSPSDFLNGNRCPRCAGKKTNQEFIKEVSEITNGSYIFLEEYVDSKTKILCKHVDNCGHEYQVSPNSFLRGRRCPKCAGNSTKSDKDFQQEIHELTEGEYVFLEEYVNNCTKILCKHVENCGHVYEVSPNSFLRGNRCPLCSPNAMKTNEQFKKQVRELVGGEYLFLEEYKGAKVKILCKHISDNCQHTYKVTPDDFLSGGARCPECARASSTKKSNKEFVSEVELLVGDEYLFLEEYKDARTKILCRHIGEGCNHEYRVVPDSFLRGSRCPMCNTSKGEQRVGEVLRKGNVSFKTEHSFLGLTGVGDGLLRFDFAILNDCGELISLIEYDGEFHYEKFYEDDGFEQIQIHDKRKNQYCKDNNIPLLRIPYWEFDNIEELVQEFLEQV